MRHLAKFREDQSNHCGDMVVIRFFPHGGRPPSWICCPPVWTTHEENLVVIAIVQNLVRIGAVVSIICKFNIFRVKLEMFIHAPIIRLLRDFTPKIGSSIKETPRGFSLHKTRRMTYRSLKSDHWCKLVSSQRIKQKN